MGRMQPLHSAPDSAGARALSRRTQHIREATGTAPRPLLSQSQHANLYGNKGGGEGVSQWCGRVAASCLLYRAVV